MNKVVNRSALILTVLLFATTFSYASSGTSGKAAAVPASCVGGSSLSGWYGMLVGGSSTSGGGKYLSGALYFNGACGITANNVSGGSGSQYVTTSATGTYGQNSDGTFTLTLNLAGQTTAQTYLIGVSESGTKARGIEYDNTSVANISLQSQFAATTGAYSTASLAGTYAVSCSGVDLNYVTFDGKGNISGVDDYAHDASVGSDPYTGTYTVNTDGTFSGSLAGGYSGYTFTGVLDDGVNEIDYTYNEGGGSSACTGRQSTSTALSGWYGILVGGPAVNGTGGKFLSGSVYFNGAGSLNGTNVNGGINGSVSDSSVTGTYVVNSDNTVTITMNLSGQTAPQTYVVGIVDAGSEAVGIESDGTADATIDMQAQLEPTSLPYTTASLNGTYAVACHGDGVDLNYVSFDGNGNLAGIDPFAGNGTQSNNPYTGTYTVNSDGTVLGTLTGSYAGYTFAGVIDNWTSEIEYNYETVSTGGFTSCMGESSYGPIGTATAAATPTFNPAPGTYSSGQTVTLSDTTSGATIHYTTDGVPPTIESPVYTNALTVSADTTILAIAVASGDNNSAIGGGAYFFGPSLTQTVATPMFNPLPGTYSSTQTVMLSDATQGASIYYSVNGGAYTLYTGAITVSATESISAQAVLSGYNNSPLTTGTYTISANQSGSTVNLSQYFNVYGIATVGSNTQRGGFDNDGYAYNSSLIGTSLNYQGVTFPLGAANTADAVVAQTVFVTQGEYSQLYLLGAAVNGAQTNQYVIAYYTDKSFTVFTQNFSDWAIPENYSGESTVLQMANRVTSTGGTQTLNVNVYGYSFALNSSKTLAAVVLPFNRNVVFLAMGMNPTATGTAIVPYIQVNGGAWAQTATATVASGSAVNLGPQPLTGGSWSWTGPNGYTSTSRQINNIPLGTGVNTYVATYTNSSGAKSTQTFTITVQGYLIANGTYLITSVHSGLAIDDPALSTKAGQVMQQYTVNGGTNQQWTVNNLGNNVITLTNGASGLVLEVAGASKSNSALVDQWYYVGFPNQQWYVTAVSAGVYELVNVNSGLALDVDGGGTTVGELIDQYTYKGNPWQQWVFTSK